MADPFGKTVNGRCESPAVNALARVGWTSKTLTPGEKVTIKGAPGRNEENVCMLQYFHPRKRTGDQPQWGIPTKNGANPLATLAKNTPRPARLANGHPKLGGPWVGIGGPDGRGPLNRGIGGPGGPDGKKGPPMGRGPGRGGPPRPEETAAGALAAKSYDQPFDDPAIKCDPANILFGWVHDRHVNEIIQKDNEITMKFGYMDFVRTIHMNQSEPPKNVAPSRGGYSIGKWDGDTLVVDTTHLAAGVLIPIIGVMYSDQMHIVERFSFDPDKGMLTRTYRADDPLYLKGPYTGQDVMAISDEPYVPYNCVELSGKNNIRSKK